MKGVRVSHIEKEAELPTHIIGYDKTELKELRKQKNLWTFGVIASAVAWTVMGFMFMPQGILQSIVGLALLWPLWIVSINGADVRRAFLALNEKAVFIHENTSMFNDWMRERKQAHGSSSYVDIEASMSSRNPGTLRVELFWLLDSVSRARHPEFAPLVFEFGDDSLLSYGADPHKLMPLLKEIVSDGYDARTRAHELELFFHRYELPAGLSHASPRSTSRDFMGD